MREKQLACFYFSFDYNLWSPTCVVGPVVNWEHFQKSIILHISDNCVNAICWVISWSYDWKLQNAGNVHHAMCLVWTALFSLWEKLQSVVFETLHTTSTQEVFSNCHTKCLLCCVFHQKKISYPSAVVPVTFSCCGGEITSFLYLTSPRQPSSAILPLHPHAKFKMIANSQRLCFTNGVNLWTVRQYHILFVVCICSNMTHLGTKGRWQ